jgi:hypothetical protein
MSCTTLTVEHDRFQPHQVSRDGSDRHYCWVENLYNYENYRADLWILARLLLAVDNQLGTINLFRSHLNPI